MTLLELRHMVAALDTVYYVILHDHLQKAFGIDGTVQSWIKNCILERTQVVVVFGHESSVSAVNSGVPQGSVLGPILFLLHSSDMNMTTHKHGLDAHLYADETNSASFLRQCKLMFKPVATSRTVNRRN